eukprot:GHVQ01024172.1.p1 GENE.GHVQ01024172.1~~GHVQ01024172.1.p1  ORF type:complete len:454 (+),score=22.58 GHVQ01024172.1:621-1982(+)
MVGVLLMSLSRPAHSWLPPRRGFAYLVLPRRQQIRSGTLTRCVLCLPGVCTYSTQNNYEKRNGRDWLYFLSMASTQRKLFPLAGLRSGSSDWSIGGRRLIASLSQIATHQMVTREFEEAFAPKTLKRLKLFQCIPPKNLTKAFYEKLNHCHSNPRSIIRVYRDYIAIDDYPAYAWLVRCFCQLANTFGFNTFWSTKDKQVVHSIPSFKHIVYDLIERKEMIRTSEVPRLLYSLACLDYRSWQLLPTLLEHVEANMERWRLPTLCHMALCLSLLGIGDSSGNNSFGPADSLSRDYSGLLETICREVDRRYCQRGSREGSAFDWAGLAFAMVMANLYTAGTTEGFLPECLKRACDRLTSGNIAHSGWVQFYLYQTLYCCDTEKPSNEVDIKKAVPLAMQQSLHVRWLESILINAQPQVPLSVPCLSIIFVVASTSETQNVLCILVRRVRKCFSLI